jgi:uncharacterized protein (DUF849 family)
MIDYAAEYGIDMDELFQEHPAHPVQVRLHREHEARGARYWELQERVADVEQARFDLIWQKARLAEAKLLEKKLFDSFVLPLEKGSEEKVRRVVTKAKRHGAYKFSVAQLEQANLAYERREGLGPNPDRVDYGA